MSDLVSIIVPIYNAEKLVAETIRSLLMQTYENIEIILIDDGSTDRSLEICSGYEEKDKRVKVYSQLNAGVSAARNYGLKKTTGKYVMFVDSDDYIEENTVETVVRLQNKYDADLLLFGYKIMQDDFSSSYVEGYQFQYYKDAQEILHQVLPKLLMNESLNPVWNKVYLAKRIRECNIQFDEKLSLGEDLLFSFEYIQNIDSLVISDESLYIYSKHGANTLSTKFHENKYEIFTYLNDKMKQISLTNQSTSVLLEVLNNIRIKNVYSVIKDYTQINNRSQLDKEKMKEIIRKESQVDYQPTDNLTYKVLKAILKTNNYYVIFFTVKLISMVRKRQGLH